MYTVSDEYKTKMLDQIQTHALSGTIGSTSFSGNDVIGVSYTNKCTEKKVNIGGVNIGTLKLTFLTDILNRGDYYGKEITISDWLLTGYDENEDPVWEEVPIGVFYIAEATWTAAGMIDITAYDVLSFLDKNLNIDQSSGTIYSWCKYIEQETGAVFGMTEAQCELLPNGTELISPYEEGNLETFRDLLSALAQMVGGFAYAERDGTWKLKTFGNTSVISIPKNRRYQGAKYSDFTTYYDTVSYVEAETNTVRYIGDGEGLVMKLGSNSFLQYGSFGAIQRRVYAIVDSIKNMTYTPFEVGLMPAFVALDLGDVVSLVDDYTEDTSSGAVMDVTWTYNKSFKIKSYGDNPNLRSAQSKTDKNIAGLMQNTTRNEVTYYNFSNIEAFTFGPEEETTIASLAFTSAQETTVKILHEFIMDILSDLAVGGSYELHYYLDDELVSYKPIESLGAITAFQSGTDTPATITRDFFYILKNVEPNVRHTWEVKIIAHDIESMTIDVNHAHVTLEGQRLYGEDYWGGYIEAKDTLTLIPFGYLSLVSITESVSADLYTSIGETASDNYTLIDLSNLTLIGMTDSVQVLKQGGFYFATEDGKDIVTENDKNIITE